MTAIPTAYAGSPTAQTLAELNSYGKAWTALGLANDQAGRASMLGHILPLMIKGSDADLEVVCHNGTGGYTVAAGKLLFIEEMELSNTATGTITPSGGAAITISYNSAATTVNELLLVLGAGDAIVLPSAASYFIGQLVDLTTFNTDVTRLLKVVAAATPHTVGAAEFLLLTSIFGCGTTATATVENISVNGRAGFPIRNLGLATHAIQHIQEALPFGPNTSVGITGNAAGTQALLSGLVFPI